ncbi:MAG: NAD(P)-dependent oxidoreductase [Christensenellales bacterium]
MKRFFVDTSTERCRIFLELAGENASVFEDFSEDGIYVFSPAKRFTEEELEAAGGKTVFAGKIKNPPENYRTVNDDERYLRHISDITAEGTLAEIIRRTRRSLSGINVLILGYGRLGKAVTGILNRVGTEVAVCTYDREEFDTVKTNTAFFGKSVNPALSRFDVIVNTVPSEIITDSDKVCLTDKNLILDLASVPCVKHSPGDGFRYVTLPGMPDVYAPQSAAEYMFDSIKRTLGNVT